ncbi:hypothetical protein DFS34DRAFT_205698 [Phlyctochytrium arcticum]|nr:hypothetical protein DFS34DRAFT_205698 [Phlyctochytrium arcticum]
MRSGNSGMVGIPNLIAPSGTIRFDDQGGITSQNASLFGGGMMIDRIGAMNNTGPGRVFAHATAGAFGNSPKANTISIKGAASTCALQIENLHPAATLEDVKASLTPYGKITDCMLVKDPQGRSTGTCIVTYERREAAMNVISQLNGQLADGRILKVAEVQSKLSIAGAAQKNATSPANQHIRATPGSMYSDRTASDLPASPLEQSPSFSSNNATSQRMFSSSPSPRGSILNRIGSGVKRKGKETADNTTFQVSI